MDMKNIGINKITLLWIMGMLTVTIHLSSCCDNNDPQPLLEEKTKQNLVGPTWKVQDVTVDGANRTDVYKDLTLKFGDNTLLATKGAPLWQPSDTWSFKTEDKKTIKRGSDGLEMGITQTDAVLTISLVWNRTTYGPGRKLSISGLHVFTFTK